jgi:RNA polymerase primary sigma factor
MVVKYRNLEGISLSAQPFVATLLCGTLRGNSKEDQAAETFLRMAEPPEHNTWGSNQRLQSHYRKGYATQLDQLERQVAALIKQLVSQAAGEGDRGPQLLSRMFPIGASGVEKREHAFTVAKRNATLNPEGVWLFSGEVRRSVGNAAWRARVALKFNTDEGAEGSVVGALDKLNPKVPYSITNGVATVDLPATADKLVFGGRSDKALHPIEARRAAVRLDVTAGIAEAESAGEEDEQ